MSNPLPNLYFGHKFASGRLGYLIIWRTANERPHIRAIGLENLTTFERFEYEEWREATTAPMADALTPGELTAIAIHSIHPTQPPL